MACPRELLANRGCPFFKRRSLFTPYADELRRTDGLAARELCDYVTAYTEFSAGAAAGLAVQKHSRFQPCPKPALVLSCRRTDRENARPERAGPAAASLRTATADP